MKFYFLSKGPNGVITLIESRDAYRDQASFLAWLYDGKYASRYEYRYIPISCIRKMIGFIPSTKEGGFVYRWDFPWPQSMNDDEQ